MLQESGFAHLHVHTQYSLLQGMIRVEPLVARVRELGMGAVAITDSHNLFGAMDFYFQCKAAGVKPILGCELRVFPPGARAGTNAAAKAFPWVVLAKDEPGFRVLSDWLSRSYLEGGENPGVPWAWLEERPKGIYLLSGGLKSELAWLILQDRASEARERAGQAARALGDSFFLELVDSGIPEQERVNETLWELGSSLGIRCVAASDAHYLRQEDAEAHEVLQCIGDKAELDLDDLRSLVPPEFYLKPAAVIRERMQRFPGACDAASEIAAGCSVELRFKDEKGRTIYHLPKFRPEGEASTVEASEPADSNEAYFRRRASEGLEARFEEPSFARKRASPDWPLKRERYGERLNEEIAMIERTGFVSYFLIVADFIAWAKARGVPVGPGRGSGVGSLVAYVLGITGLDPLDYGLLFERFINPERISLPDFDVDFCRDRRGEVIEYVAGKYGAKNVCQIATVMLLQARQAVKDVARVLGLGFAESNQLTALFPKELGITVAKAIEAEPRLKDKADSDPRVARVLDYADKLEGLCKAIGVHPAGVIITEKAVSEYCPLYVGRDGLIVTQYDMSFCEKIGLVKFDFLGLKTLTVIDTALKLAREGARPGEPVPPADLEGQLFDDPRPYALISAGDTDGVFQLESDGMKDLCRRIAPTSLEDLTAIVALYRPGPLGSGMVDDFIEAKHGRKPIVFELSAMEPILRETYGVILYQEQVMRIARELAGYSLGQADLLRRAMGKKLPEEMNRHREIFVRGAGERGIPAQKAETIFGLMEKFAEYGFNKSHSAGYAVLTYRTAFLKAAYPAEFLAALMTTEMASTEDLMSCISDARAHGIRVLPPDVNRSGRKFTVERSEDGEKAIRFGLEGIKGVGSASVDAVLEARAGGGFEDPLDFARRVPVKKMNRKVFESLVMAGALDSISPVSRPGVFGAVDSLLEMASAEQEERELGQSSLFGEMRSSEIRALPEAGRILREEAEWPVAKRLGFEKQVLGLYLTGHPIERWQSSFSALLGTSVQTLAAKAEALAAHPPEEAGWHGGGRPRGPEVRLGCLISELQERRTRKGALMGILALEDGSRSLEALLFGKAFESAQAVARESLAGLEAVVVTGTLEAADGRPKIIVESIELARAWLESRAKELRIRLDIEAASPDQLRELKSALLASPGKCAVRIEFHGRGFDAEQDVGQRVSGSPEVLERVNGLFGAPVAAFR